MTSLDAHDSLVKAAQKLSSAREKRRLHLAVDPTTIHGQERVETAKEAYDAAYKLYTNPFNAEKNVDARWPTSSKDPYTADTVNLARGYDPHARN